VWLASYSRRFIVGEVVFLTQMLWHSLWPAAGMDSSATLIFCDLIARVTLTYPLFCTGLATFRSVLLNVMEIFNLSLNQEEFVECQDTLVIVYKNEIF
jgi:hypothetical protein